MAEIAVRHEISIVIPSWNGREILARNLPSVEAALARHAPGGEILVVDDGSSDGTVDWLRAAHPTVGVVARSPNAGFAAAVNAGVAASRHDRVFLLNNDMKLDPNCLGPLMAPFGSAADLFATTPRIVNRTFGGDEGVTACALRYGLIETVFPERGRPVEGPARRLDDPTLERTPATPGASDDRAGSARGRSRALREILFACGGAALFDRERWRALGGLDPLFAPFYWEDVDLSWRARKRGWRIVHVGEAEVAHEHSATIGARFDPRAVQVINERNRLLFQWKSVTSRRMTLRHLAWLPIRLARAIFGRPAFLAGFAKAAVRLGPVLAGRRAERAAARVSDEAILEAFRAARAEP